MNTSFQHSQVGFPHSMHAAEDAEERHVSGSIGDYIRDACKLSDEQIDQILSHQKERGIRFGEAAVSLRLATPDDVIWALSKQFKYPYVPSDLKGSGELIAASQPFSDESEAFREMRSQLLMGALSPQLPRRALAVMSPGAGEGRSFVAANLAVAFSQLGGRTVIVDADMRTPRLREIFGLSDAHAGLSTILSGRAERRMIQQVRGLSSLFVVPSGPVPPNPQELLQRPTFGLLITELLHKFDHVLVDTPSASHGSDARVIAARCGVALVLGRKGRTRMDQLQGVVSSLEKSSVTVAGVVMNEY
ncbi:MAG: polysaccharide biosynthesis tyrosine autokinase [Rubrivivax sp.]|nr:polysaccharide biosynthesis tyrosine autokinase [Rubrivivax sp.]